MFEEEIRGGLQEMYNGGMTYKEISEKTGISQSVVANCISGARPLKNPSISLLLKVFPNCRIDLNGESPPPVNQEAGISEADAEKIASEAREDFRNQVIKALITLDMRAEDSLLALKTIQNL